jgi:2-(1,2-epoxy-1,2-dihydrophenyl)acetyl-CoA isomerase
VASDHEFADAWWEYAMEFAEGPRTAIGYIKQNVLDAAHLPLREALVAEAQRQTLTGQTPDHKEAIRAWVEKREPRFGPNLE